MATQWQRYTCSIVGQAVTLTPKAGTESKPNYLGNSTIVVNTTANPPSADLWKVKDEYIITVESVTP